MKNKYPELLRDLYDKIEDVLAETGIVATGVDIPWQVTEWIRKHWSGRYLIPSWWGLGETASADSENRNLPGVDLQVDQLRSQRGRELRAATLAIILEKIALPRPCHLATAIAALVEAEWAGKKVYVPFGTEVDRAIRDLEVWRDFGGGMGDIERVVAKHKISQSAIYDAFRRVQAAKKEREEPMLPGF